MPTETPEQWNERYAEGNTPWDNQQPDSELQRIVAQFGIQRPLRRLDSEIVTIQVEPGAGTAQAFDDLHRRHSRNSS